MIPCIQEQNPADVEGIESSVDGELDDLTLRTNSLEFIKRFISSSRSGKDGGDHLILLGDAGMGKSSFLCVLYLILYNSVWPTDNIKVKIYRIPGLTSEVTSSIRDKRKTILLLDAFDEDIALLGVRSAEERLSSLLAQTKDFYKVIITGRTQFFSKSIESEIDRKRKIFLGGYGVPVRFISPFDDSQVKEYLDRRLIGDDDLRKANKIISKIRGISCRPLILSYIEDLMNIEDEKGHLYIDLYEQVISSWLRRESRKMNGEMSISEGDLKEKCTTLAWILSARRWTEISMENLMQLTGASRSEGLDFLVRIEFVGRSILNNKSNGNIRFAHKSFQDYLCAKYHFNHRMVKTDCLAYMGKVTYIFVQELFSRAINKGEKNFPGMIVGLFDLRNFYFKEVDLSRSTFYGSTGQSRQMISSKPSSFTNVNFKDSILSYANLNDCLFVNCRFEECQMIGSSWDRAQLIDCVFVNCALNESIFNHTAFSKCAMEICDLTSAVFVEGVLDIACSDCVYLNAVMSKHSVVALNIVYQGGSISHNEQYLRNLRVRFDGNISITGSNDR